ncbi:MAG: helix-turn-helix domain-containing protein [Myxococcota bacterium]
MTDSTPTDAAANLARNVRQLRESRGLSQAQLARLSGLPRPTWATLESGGANPTLNVLLKVSAALQVSLEELVGPPKAVARLYAPGELRSRRRGKVVVADLLPDRVAGLQMERMELPPGAGMRGVPHTAGTREYLCCERGEILLTASDEQWTLRPGHVLVFRGDQKHAYRNPGRSTAVAYAVVALRPPSSS